MTLSTRSYFNHVSLISTNYSVVKVPHKRIIYQRKSKPVCFEAWPGCVPSLVSSAQSMQALSSGDGRDHLSDGKQDI